MLYIRTDANSIIASGHVMRCLTIANEVRKLGEQVTFITADMQGIELISSNGFTAICLESEWNNLDSELDKLITVIKEYKIEKLLIDSYYVTERYLSKLRGYVKLIYIDDLSKFPYPVDILINYNNYACSLGYEKWAKEYKTKLLLGCSYAPLREEFREITRIVSKNIKNILLTTGGSDSYHVAYKFLQYLINEYYDDTPTNMEDEIEMIKYQIESLNFHVVIGKFHSDKEKLEKIVQKYPNIVLHKEVNNISQLMKQSDIAITAGGFTMYELCACGVPMITYSLADNQILGVRGFQQLGVAKYCGDVRDGEEILWKEFVNALKLYSLNFELNCENSIKKQALVDGFGACRLTKFLL